MQSETTAPQGVTAAMSAVSEGPAELWRGARVIFSKHMYKFMHNMTEVGGTLAAPILLAVTFGAGMDALVKPSTLGGMSYLSFITPGIIAFTALNGAVNAGMTALEEKIRGYMKEYLVAPIPRLSILLASTMSGLVKTLLQSLLILIIAVIFGARFQTDPVGILGALLVMILFMLAFVGFFERHGAAEQIDRRLSHDAVSADASAPFPEQCALPARDDAAVDEGRGAHQPHNLRRRRAAHDAVRRRRAALCARCSGAGALCRAPGLVWRC
ncbi:MAG: ABC transporter permease [Anaerolineales bacterium]|nr:ABC transporter permease [Anaerolineales bacterium]